MLTIKELKYVDLWANKTPMPGVEYSLDVIKSMENCYNIYKEKYRGKEYNILFSNSDEIDLAILDKNLCHMLGVDFKNIKGEYFNEYRKNVFGTSDVTYNSYELLELIFENKEKVAEMDNDPNNLAKAINYYKSSIKCEIFNKLSDFSKFNFLSFDGEHRENDEICKNLVVASNEKLTPYFMMGIIKSSAPEDNGMYVVNTLNAPLEPKNVFENKEVSIPTQMIITDNSKLTKLQATPEEKIQLLTLYSSMINEFNIPNMINIYNDYQNILNYLDKSEQINKIKVKNQ